MSVRRRWRYDSSLKEMVEIGTDAPAEGLFYVRGDLAPYRSMCDGSMVDGRAAHREHLKKHGVVEIGDAYDKSLPKPTVRSDDGLKETIARITYERLSYN